MKRSDLENFLTMFNHRELDRLEQEHKLPPAYKSTLAARVYALPKPPEESGSLLCRDGQADKCFHGIATGGHGYPGALEKLISLSSPAGSPAHGRVAVGAVIDGKQPVQNAPNDDWPIVLATGINYGQQVQSPPPGNDYLLHPTELYDDTGMRPRVAAVVQLRVSQGCNVQPLPGEAYHLVAANFFPWITNVGWNDDNATKNVLTEELLLCYFGWPNPLDFVAWLIHDLYAQCRTLGLPPHRGVTHIIFHGAQNAAMRCGMALTRQLTRDHARVPQKVPLYRLYRETPAVPALNDHNDPYRTRYPGPDVIFCDNLAPSPAGAGFNNAVCLWQPNLHGNASAVLDEDE